MPVHWSQAHASPRVTAGESDQQGARLSASGCVDQSRPHILLVHVCAGVCVSSKGSQITRQAVFPSWGPPPSGGQSAKSRNWGKNSP